MQNFLKWTFLISWLTIQSQALADVRVAFGSCARQDQEQPIWSTIEAQKPNMFLFIGDNIYGDTDDPVVLRNKYLQLGAKPQFQSFRQQVPMLATWDDHDYGRNDAGREYPMKVQSQEIFLDFFGVPKDSARRNLEGVYHAEIQEREGLRIQYIMLDTRYHRSAPRKGSNGYEPELAPDATVLGATQWAWLEEQLLQGADIRIVASSIQFLAADHRYEKWQNFPQERQRMLNLIARTEAEGVIFISGDRHLGEISVLSDSPVPYPLYDLTASGMTDPLGEDFVLETNKLRYAGTKAHTTQQFGMIEVRRSKLPQNPWQVSLVLLDGQGRRLEKLDFPLSQLQTKQGPQQIK